MRVVSDGAGGILAGRTLPGRGAWLCSGETARACAEAAVDRGALARALRAEVRADQARTVLTVFST